MNIYNIPGKLEGIWREDVKTVIDTWSSYFVTMEEFEQAVLVKGVDYAKRNGGIAWIVDSTQAIDVFPNEIQAFIESHIFPAFASIGIKYFITIKSQISALTRLNISTYSAKAAPHGVMLIESDSVENAIEWLKQEGK